MIGSVRDAQGRHMKRRRILSSRRTEYEPGRKGTSPASAKPGRMVGVVSTIAATVSISMGELEEEPDHGVGGVTLAA